MTINIKSSEADKLVRELSELTGESITEIVVKSLAQRLEREKSQNNVSTSLEQELLTITQSYQNLPILDDRSEEEILGYD
jgi:antitoxin VapB